MEIPAHKMILAACSPYFYAMFSDFEEAHQDKVTVRGVDHQALQLLVDYVYTSHIEVSEDNVQVIDTSKLFMRFEIVENPKYFHLKYNWLISIFHRYFS